MWAFLPELLVSYKMMLNPKKTLDRKQDVFGVNPTIFLVEKGGKPKQVIEIEISNKTKEILEATLLLKIQEGTQDFLIKGVVPGKQVYPIMIDEQKKKTNAKFTLQIGGNSYETEAVLKLQKRWELYLVPSVHTDPGYNIPYYKTCPLHAKNLDYVIDCCNATKDYPEGAKFKWNLEVSWQFFNYEKMRPKDKVDELIKLIKEGVIDVSAVHSNQLTSLCSHEELCRLTYHSNKLRQKHGFNIESAIITDIPSHTWALPTILAKSGISYLAVGVNNVRGSFHKNTEIITPFYWEGPDGSKILTWASDGYRHGQVIGLVNWFNQPANPLLVYSKLKEHIQSYEEKGYPFEMIMLYGLLDDNWSAANVQQASQIIKEWNEKFVSPKFVIATNTEFFKLLEARHGKKIPTHRGDWGSYWEDGVAASAKEEALLRKGLQKFSTAETLSTLAAFFGKPYHKKTLEVLTEKALLLTEHGWGGIKSILEPFDKEEIVMRDAKVKLIKYVEKNSSKIIKTNLNFLASNLKNENGPSLLVFNQLGHSRTEIAYSNMPSKEHFRLVDASNGEEVPYQIVKRNKNSKLIAFLAKNMPSLGYKVYEIKNAAKTCREPSCRLENILENEFYRIEINLENGSIKSIIDKEMGKELVDETSEYGINQLIYDAGEQKSTLPTPLPKFFKDLEKRKPLSHSRHTTTKAKILHQQTGPVYSSIIIGTSAFMCPKVEAEIRLFNGIKRIDIINKVNKKLTFQKEGAYYAFPFKINNATIRCELPDAVMTPEKEQISGACKDWYAVQNWVDISNKKHGITWATVEAPLVEFGKINTGLWLKKLNMQNGTLISYIMNNYWFTNYKAGQGGEFEFKYSITSHAGKCNESEAAKFGSAAANPLLTIPIKKNENGLLDKKNSFLKLNKDNVRLLAFKQAEDSQGYVIRLGELQGKKTDVKLQINGIQIHKAYLTNFGENAETEIKVANNTITVPIGKYSITTLRVETKIKQDL